MLLTLNVKFVSWKRWNLFFLFTSENMILKKNHVSWREIEWIFNLLTSGLRIYFPKDSIFDSFKCAKHEWKYQNPASQLKYHIQCHNHWICFLLLFHGFLDMFISNLRWCMQYIFKHDFTIVYHFHTVWVTFWIFSLH